MRPLIVSHGLLLLVSKQLVQDGFSCFLRGNLKPYAGCSRQQSSSLSLAYVSRVLQGSPHFHEKSSLFKCLTPS